MFLPQREYIIMSYEDKVQGRPDIHTCLHITTAPSLSKSASHGGHSLETLRVSRGYWNCCSWSDCDLSATGSGIPSQTDRGCRSESRQGREGRQGQDRRNSDGKATDSTAEVLYVEAWAEMATQLAAKFKEGDLIAIAGGTVISASQPYSTSKLLYYLRLKGTLGIQVQIANVDKVPWNLPGFLHPLVPLASLARVRDRQQICVAAVVVENPGSVERQTSNGMASVCNAIVQAGNVRVRCAFWREHAEKLAAVELNSAILLYQVLVSKRKQDQDSWELSSWRGTQIVSCPQDHADKLCPGYNFFTSSSFSRYSLFFGCFTCYLFL